MRQEIGNLRAAAMVTLGADRPEERKAAGNGSEGFTSFSEILAPQRPIDHELRNLYLQAILLCDFAPFPDADEEAAAWEIRVLDALEFPRKALEKIVRAFIELAANEQGLFPKTERQIALNFVRQNEKFPEENNRLALEEAFSAYLANTPFLDFFFSKIPFKIGITPRFSHALVIAMTGHGKSQFLQSMIWGDLRQAQRGRGSLVVMDNQEKMLEKLMRLEAFDPRHRGKSGNLADWLYYLDFGDSEHPPGINFFDLDLDGLSEAQKRERIAQANDVLIFFFVTFMGADFSVLQEAVFQYSSELMFFTPDATLYTLRDFLASEGPDDYESQIQKLDAHAGEFIRERLFSDKYTSTRNTIVSRIDAVLANPYMRVIFAQKKNRVDFFEALNRGACIFINTNKKRLGRVQPIAGALVYAVIFLAAIRRESIPEDRRRSTFFYADEIGDIVNDKIREFLIQARKFRLGTISAFQYTDQLKAGAGSANLLQAMLGNTAIKIIGKVSAKDAKIFENEIIGSRADDFLGLRKSDHSYAEYLCSVANLTPRPVKITCPFGLVERAAQMPDDAYQALMAANRERVSGSAPAPAESPNKAERPREDGGGGFQVGRRRKL